MKNLIKKLFPIITLFNTQKIFNEDYLRFNKFIKSLDIHQLSYNESGLPVLVVVSPWMYTAVPWYAITIALLLSLRGSKVEILFDDLDVDDLATGDNQSSVKQCKKISAILDRIASKFRIHKLSDMDDANLSNHDRSVISKLAKFNRVHRYQTSMTNPDNLKYEKDWYDMQISHFTKIKSFFNNYKCKQIIMPGGVYGNSGLYLHALDDNIRISSYDSGKGRALICVNGIAGYQSDIQVVLADKQFNNMTDDIKLKVKEITMQELQARMNGTDAYSTQLISSEDTRSDEIFDIVIPLNITWDLPALGKHECFEDDYSWIIETVKWILKYTQATVAVRQHPHERNHTSGDDLHNNLIELFGDQQRFHYFGSSDEINSYTLISKAKIVLPYVSTIGIEAALIGKTVIVESDSYYANSSFVIKSKTRNEYFNNIEYYLDNPMILTESQKNEALNFYYLGQLCTAELTNFTPHPLDYREWVLNDIETLKKDKSVQKIVEALHKQIPLALLTHKELVNS